MSNPWDVVRYDSPVFAGFSVSADWGMKSYWDVYGRYAGEWNGIKVAATTGWSEVNCPLADQNAVSPTIVGGRATCNGGIGIDSDFHATTGHPVDMGVGYWQSGLYIEHVATGVWVLGNYGREFLPGGFNALANPEGPGEALTPFNNNPDTWYIKAGVRERWTSLGHTVLYGEYDKQQSSKPGAHLPKNVSNP